MDRVRQLIQASRVLRERDPKFIPIAVGAALFTIFAAVVIGFGLLGRIWLAILIAVLFVPLSFLIVLGRRLQTMQNEALHGQVGAPAAVVQSMRGWYVTPVIALNKKQDFVHRAVGPGGVVLIGEGQPGRVQNMLRQETKRHERIAGGTDVTVLQVGDAERQVRIKELRTKLMKLPRVVKKGEVRELHVKLEAVAPTNVPNPGGPIPQQRRGLPR